VANTLSFIRRGDVGFIDWLDVCCGNCHVAAERLVLVGSGFGNLVGLGVRGFNEDCDESVLIVADSPAVVFSELLDFLLSEYSVARPTAI